MRRRSCPRGGRLASKAGLSQPSLVSGTTSTVSSLPPGEHYTESFHPLLDLRNLLCLSRTVTHYALHYETALQILNRKSVKRRRPRFCLESYLISISTIVLSPPYPPPNPKCLSMTSLGGSPARQAKTIGKVLIVVKSL